MSEMSDADPVIEAVGLTKRFGHTVALDGLDLRVGRGQVHGFLGPNGAGKSTTIRVLLGLLRADAGTVRLLGKDPWADAATLHRRLAYVPADVNLWPNLTGGEAIDLLGRARGGLDPARRDQLVERFELDPRTKGRAYSKGNRQKVALVAALAALAALPGLQVVGHDADRVHLVLVGASLPLVQAVQGRSLHLVGVYAGAALALVPGLLLVAGLGVLLLGWRPRWFPAMWAVVGWSVLASWVLPLFNLPRWLVELQPWGHLPRLPTDAVRVTPLVLESCLGLVLLIAGMVANRRRNMVA